MKILVSTSHSLLEIDEATLEIRRIHSGKGLYYGIANTGDVIYVAARNRLVSSDLPQDEERGEILLFSRKLEFIKSLSADFPLRDLHEVAWDGECLWATCPYDNFVAKWNGNAWEKWFPQPEDSYQVKDKHHYNSILFESNLLWLLAHNFGESELISFNKNKMELMSRQSLGFQAHNMWRENGLLHTCSSAQGLILNEIESVVSTGGFPRGYCRSGNKRFVGISELAERGARDFTTSKIVIYDSEWNLLNTLELVNEGLLLDMKMLGPMDEQVIAR
jgi:hypothetical protein